jgi:hypothetical protein
MEDNAANHFNQLSVNPIGPRGGLKMHTNKQEAEEAKKENRTGMMYYQSSFFCTE